MRPIHFLRTAAVLTGLQSVLHTFGGVFGKPDPGPATLAVQAMQANHFPAMGMDRTYWDFFIGFGVTISIYLAAEAVVFWLLGSLSEKTGAALRPILGVFLAGYLALAVLALRYFLAPPLICDTLIVLCLLMAMIAAGKRRSASADSEAVEKRFA